MATFLDVPRQFFPNVRRFAVKASRKLRLGGVTNNERRALRRRLRLRRGLDPSPSRPRTLRPSRRQHPRMPTRKEPFWSAAVRTERTGETCRGMRRSRGADLSLSHQSLGKEPFEEGCQTGRNAHCDLSSVVPGAASPAPSAPGGSTVTSKPRPRCRVRETWTRPAIVARHRRQRGTTATMTRVPGGVGSDATGVRPNGQPPGCPSILRHSAVCCATRDNARIARQPTHALEQRLSPGP
jgi:hypothetical protein